MDELMALPANDTNAEFALARTALAMLQQHPPNTPLELLEIMDLFFSVAEKKKRIDSGTTINVRWDENMVNELKQRFSKLIRAFKAALDSRRGGVLDDNTIAAILSQVKAELQPNLSVTSERLVTATESFAPDKKR
jgi:hypothetical protein